MAMLNNQRVAATNFLLFFRGTRFLQFFSNKKNVLVIWRNTDSKVTTEGKTSKKMR